MQTLDELCAFLGFPVGALEVARYGGPRDPSLNMAGVLVKGSGDQTPTSLSELIGTVGNLPAVTLEAKLISSRRGQEPHEVRVRLSASPGIVWDTGIEYVLNDSDTFGDGKDLGAAGGEVRPGDLAAGSWEIFATREGIGSIGLTVLRRSVGKVVVTRQPQPAPEVPKPPVVAPPTVPWVTCQIEIDGSNPGFGGVTNYVIYGQGMENDEPVNVFENRGLYVTTQSNNFGGGWRTTIGILHSIEPQQHVFWARGERSKRESMKAGITL